MEERTQIIVAVETLLIMIAYGIALVRRAIHRFLCESVYMHLMPCCGTSNGNPFSFSCMTVFSIVVVKERMLLRANQ